MLATFLSYRRGRGKEASAPPGQNVNGDGYMVQVSAGERIALRNQFRTLVQSAIVDGAAR